MPLKCPLCDNSSFISLYKLSGELLGVTIVRCQVCAHVYTQSKNDQENLYSEGVYKVVENRNSVFDKILTWESKGILKNIRILNPGNLKLLDFGCGKGKFADIAQKKGYNVKCIETSIERAAYAHDIYGLDVSTSYYTEGKVFAGEFQAITLLHVLEHLPNPKELLTKLINSNLCNSGLVIFEVPNFNSLQRKIAGKGWMHFDAQHHISHFSPSKLNEIGDNLNLKNMKTTFFSFHLGVLGMVDALLKLIGFKKNIIFELKNNRNKTLKIIILILIPPALLIEVLASIFNQGGIVRKYFILQTHDSKFSNP